MNEVVTAIRNVLIPDTELLTSLGSNPPFNNPDGTPAKINSIVPTGVLKSLKSFPVVTLDQGQFNQLGDFFYQNVFYIRCYNDVNATHFTINKVQDRIKKLLHLKELDMDDTISVKLKWEGRLQPLLDEDFNLRFVEDSYRIYLL